jgi:hypothetical protein
MSLFSNVLTQEDIEYLNNIPEVLEAKARLSTTTVQYFKVRLNETIRAALNKMGLNLSNVTEVPMRWIKGDTAPHVDRGASEFENTYLVYLNNSEGNFTLEDTSYPIAENTGFVFSEGLLHKTEGTGLVPRLLLGPMNEFAQPVGYPPPFIVYYASYEDAMEQIDSIAVNYTNFVVGNTSEGSIEDYTKWKIAYNGGGVFPSTVFNNGTNLENAGFTPDAVRLYAYTPQICFLEGTQILCKDGHVRIEELKCGDLVKTINGYKAIVGIKKDTIVNPGTDERTVNRLYSYDDKLFLTGAHSVLVESLTQEEKEKTAAHLGLMFTEDVEKLFVAESKYKLMAYLDSRAKPWASEGKYTIWHIALESENENVNYGIYANTYLVESCSINSLNKSLM